MFLLAKTVSIEIGQEYGENSQPLFHILLLKKVVIIITRSKEILNLKVRFNQNNLEYFIA
jgi:hypothetical protein